jgi:hypothetical protein
MIFQSNTHLMNKIKLRDFHFSTDKLYRWIQNKIIFPLWRNIIPFLQIIIPIGFVKFRWGMVNILVGSLSLQVECFLLCESIIFYLDVFFPRKKSIFVTDQKVVQPSFLIHVVYTSIISNWLVGYRISLFLFFLNSLNGQNCLFRNEVRQHQFEQNRFKVFQIKIGK